MTDLQFANLMGAVWFIPGVIAEKNSLMFVGILWMLMSIISIISKYKNKD